MSNLLRMAFIVASMAFSAASHACCESQALESVTAESDVLAMYSLAVLEEFCTRSEVDDCEGVLNSLRDQVPDIYCYSPARAQDGAPQIMALYPTDDGNPTPYVIFSKDKDGWLMVIARGLHFDRSESIVSTFLESGNSL